MLAKTPSSSTQTVGTGSLAHQGNMSQVYNIVKGEKCHWIIDSSTSDHMTGDRRLFTQYTIYSDHLPEKIANGSLAKIVGI